MVRSRAIGPVALWRLSLLVLVYVGLELSNPMMPGAFTFDVSDSVDGVSRHPGRGHERPAAGLPFGGGDGRVALAAPLPKPPTRARPETFRAPVVTVRHTLPRARPATLDDH